MYATVCPSGAHEYAAVTLSEGGVMGVADAAPSSRIIKRLLPLAAERRRKLTAGVRATLGPVDESPPRQPASVTTAAAQARARVRVICVVRVVF
jgi:hypothetical protein